MFLKNIFTIILLFLEFKKIVYSLNLFINCIKILKILLKVKYNKNKWTLLFMN